MPQQHEERKEQDGQTGLEDLNVTRPAPPAREEPKPPSRPEPAGLEDQSVTQPKRT